jgi:hypothetical protein
MHSCLSQSVRHKQALPQCRLLLFMSWKSSFLRGLLIGGSFQDLHGISSAYKTCMVSQKTASKLDTHQQLVPSPVHFEICIRLLHNRTAHDRTHPSGTAFLQTALENQDACECTHRLFSQLMLKSTPDSSCPGRNNLVWQSEEPSECPEGSSQSPPTPLDTESLP